MKTNMGTIDRGVRLVIAAVLAYLALGTGMLSGILFWLALVVAGVFTLTALVGNCPLYSIVGLKTCKNC
jgi:hypothetical protein